MGSEFISDPNLEFLVFFLQGAMPI